MVIYRNDTFKSVTELIPADDDMRHQGQLRVVSAECKLQRRGRVTRIPAPDPLIGSMKSYMAGRPNLEVLGFENGHLIGMKLGGIDSKGNIVPMFSYFNQVKYKALESEIYNDRLIQFMRVRVEYRDDDKVVPDKLIVEVRRSGGKGDDQTPYNYTHYRTLTMKNPHLEPYPIDKDIAERIRPSLPEQRPEFEPYAFLERLGLPTVQIEGGGYSEIQRTYILTANALYTHAETSYYFLRSDDRTDIHQMLCITGSKNRPEIDHVVPRTKSGGNSYRNALVLSKAANGAKSAKLSPDKIELLRIAVDERPGRTRNPIKRLSDEMAAVSEKKRKG